MATWPETLPQYLQQQDTQHQAPDLLLVFQPDMGPPVVRRRGTVNYEVMQGSMIMTTAQLTIFRPFWISDCASEITFPDPYSGGTVTVVFLEKPTWKPLGGGNFQVSMKFGVLP